MEKFLDFLASNYIYFLIAAGILFFALIGFIVDLKRRNKSEEESSVTPEVEVPIQPVEENVEINNVSVEPVPTVPAEEFNPAPPMPEFELDSTPVTPGESDSTPITPVELDSTPVTPIELNATAVESELEPNTEETPKIEIEELK